jgi:hypothetical protein
MKGLRIDAPNARNFKNVFRSVLDDLNRYYWLIDTQSGPFSTTDKPNFRELDAEIDRYRVDVPELRDTSSSLWRPGVFRFADLLVVDEFTYLVGIEGSEKEVVAIVPSLSDAPGISPKLFSSLEKNDGAALLHLNECWEVYSTNLSLMNRISKMHSVGPADSDAL